jgi:medium-chain acyl-[acyl-carrier-protein] hydrolase
MRLFIFPYAGGSPAAFWKWAAGFPDHVETWIAHYPGRGSRYNEPLLKEIGVLVERLSDAIQPFLEKPFVFFGHSLGGLVAFELSRTLRQNNLPQPDILYVSACGAPQLPNPYLPIHRLPDAEFLKALQKFNGIPAEIINHAELMELLLPTLRADFEIFERYNYNPNVPALDSPIIAFSGENDPRVSREFLEAWATQTNSTFKSKFFPGDHFFINDMKDAVIQSITDEIAVATTQEPESK